MGWNLVFQWLGMAIIAAAIATLTSWPWGILWVGAFVLAVGVIGEWGWPDEEEAGRAG